MGLSLKELVEKTSSPERVLKVCLNGRLRGDYDLLREELDELVGGRATMGGGEREREIAEEMQALEAQMAAESVVFRFRGLHHWRLKEIQKRFPSDEEGKAWDVDTASPALISECLVDPKLTEEEVRTFLEQGNTRLAEELFSTAWLACNQGNDIPKSARASALIRGSGSN